MPSFNPTQISLKARNANTVTILIGTQPIAFAQTVSHTFDLGTESLHGIGSAKPQEIQQLKVSPQITVDNFALTTVGQTLIETTNTPLSSLLANNQFNLFIVDGTNGNTLFTYVSCTASNYSQNISANQPITEAITFLAMDVLDNTGASILVGPQAFTVTA